MPPKKRIKVNDEADDDDAEEKQKVLLLLVDKVWEHYRAYLDSCNDDCEGDVDELQEIVELLQDVVPVAAATLLGTTSRHDLLPIVASMAHYQLAGDYMSQTVDKTTTTTSDNHDDTDMHDVILKHMPAE